VHSIADNSYFTTLTVMDYSKEVEELLLWFVLFDWWVCKQRQRGKVGGRIPKEKTQPPDM